MTFNKNESFNNTQDKKHEMFISKIPYYISINERVLIYQNVLSDFLIKECICYANICVQNDFYNTTNHLCWNKEIVGRSNVIKIIILNKVNEKLKQKICYELNNKYNLITDNLIINIHIMQEGCYVQEHTDNHVKYAFSIYLNDFWEEKYGGMFQFDIEDEKYNVLPSYNTMVLIKDNLHRVTKINSKLLRISLQGFYPDSSLYYKTSPIDQLLHSNIGNKIGIFF